MKREEFPTFLNEQPTIIFGRTARELLIMAIGLSTGYLLWLNLGAVLPGMSIGVTILKGFCALVVVGLSAIVALLYIAGRPLEEWIFVAVFYFLIPKVYIYMPLEDNEAEDDEQDARQRQMMQSNIEDDDY